MQKNEARKKVFIYARKSKFTKQSESIETQIDKCRQYIAYHPVFDGIADGDIEVYCDEGWSGKDLNRPGFKAMNERIRAGECGYVIVYRLDRISRSVSDFAVLLNEFKERGVSFISVTEQFDTASSTGQLMMVITSAFAEFERSIIAERVRDNMHKLAESGRWLGGNTPLGFSSARARNTSHLDAGDDKERLEYKLAPIDKELAVVKQIYKKYLELRSLSQLEEYLLNHGIGTRRNKEFKIHTLKGILQNPVYCTADSDSYSYFRQTECDLCLEESELNKGRGFIGFNKTQSNKKRTKNDVSEWIIAIGKHRGVIPGADWVKAQRLLEQNADRSYRRAHNPTALLSGVLRCSCGSYMRPKYHRENNSGERPYSYMCELKERSKRAKCGANNLNGKFADDMICNILLDFDVPESHLNKQITKLKKNLSSADATQRESIAGIEKLIAEKKKEKEKLLDFIASGKVTNNELHEEITAKLIDINNSIHLLEQEAEQLKNAEIVKEKLIGESLTAEYAGEYFRKNFAGLSVPEKRELIGAVFDKVTWDGENLSVFSRGSRK